MPLLRATVFAPQTATTGDLEQYLPLDGSKQMAGSLSMGGNSIILDTGDIYSKNWDGALPANLSTEDLTATKGFYLDASVGVIQAMDYFGDAPDVPAGVIAMFGAAAAPAGWLLCDGTAVSRTTYAALFAVIGTTFGVGDGSTTFNLPDLRGRFPLGKAAAGTGSTLGGTGGTLEHTHTGPSHTHTGPSHTHSWSGSTGADATSAGSHLHSGPLHDHSIAHTHTFSDTSSTYSAANSVAVGVALAAGSHSHTVSGTTSVSSAANTGNAGSGNTSSDGSHSHSHSHSVSGSTGAEGTGATSTDGTGATGPATPSFIALQYIIKF